MRYVGGPFLEAEFLINVFFLCGLTHKLHKQMLFSKQKLNIYLISLYFLRTSAILPMNLIQGQRQMCLNTNLKKLAALLKSLQ